MNEKLKVKSREQEMGNFEIENYLGLYRLTLALKLYEEGAKLIPLTKTRNLLEDYKFDHTPLKEELISWFGFLEYDIGIVHTKTITHINIIYAKMSGECQQIHTAILIEPLTRKKAWE